MRNEQLRLFTPDDDSNLRNRRRLIIIPLDTFILSSVVIILLFILAFSLGVERGRKIYYANLESKENLEKDIVPDDGQPAKIQTKMENKLVAETKNEPVRPIVSISVPRPAQPQVKPDTTAKIETPKAGISGNYSIQIATYNKESYAQIEAKVLQAKGFPAFIAKKSNYVVLYVGPFKTKPEADKYLSVIKKTYKDCILRRLQ